MASTDAARVHAAAALTGAATLVAEVAWLRPITLMTGDTTLAVALGVAALFAGLAAGAWRFGRAAALRADPGHFAARLCLSAAAALLVSVPLLFALTDLHLALLARLGRGANLPLAGLLLFAALLLPAAWLGGVAPALSEALARRHPDASAAVARMWAWSTLGGVAGALAAGLLLTPSLGLSASCVIAAGLCALAGVLLRTGSPTPPVILPPPPPPGAHPALSPCLLLALAAGAGFSMLGYEVLWSRTLSTVVTNSQASFALLLASVLTGLAFGAWLASHLDLATRWAPLAVLQTATGLSALLLGLVSRHLLGAVVALRESFQVRGWLGGLASEAVCTAALVLVPSVLLGIHLPLLFAAAHAGPREAGPAWGRTLAANTLGGVAGSLVTASLLIPLAGVQAATAVLAALNVGLGLLVWRLARPGHGLRRLAAGAGALALAAGLCVLPPSVPLAPEQRLLAHTDGAGAAASVLIDNGGDRTLLLNGRYVLGGTGGVVLEYRQALIPALLHPRPHTAFHLGTGTGNTAGVLARLPGLERLVTCDNVPAVLDLARAHFGDSNLGLFDQPHVFPVTADGRHWLASEAGAFDLIVLDNLLPWLAGTSALLTREHFQRIRDHLRPGGLACVWIPLHQVDVRTVTAVLRTFEHVFPETHLWLATADLQTSLALIGSLQPLRLGHLLSDPRLRGPELRAALDTALIRDASDIFAGLTARNVRPSAVPTLTDRRPLLDLWTTQTFHRDLAHHPHLFDSPAIAGLWSTLATLRRGQAADLRQALGVTRDDASGEGAAVWRRWSSTSQLVEGLAALCQGDRRAERLCLDAARMDPGNGLARRTVESLLITLAQSRQWRAAANLGNRAGEIFALSPRARVAWADALLNAGEHYRARRTLEALLAEQPGDLRAGLQLLRVLDAMDRPADARALAESLHTQHPGNETVERLWIQMDGARAGHAH